MTPAALLTADGSLLRTVSQSKAVTIMIQEVMLVVAPSSLEDSLQV
jgi:hypothetical protein